MAPPVPLLKHFELARRDLLELTTTNRLLSTPRDKNVGSALEIVDESGADVFRILVSEASSLRFDDGQSPEDQSSDGQMTGVPALEGQSADGDGVVVVPANAANPGPVTDKSSRRRFIRKKSAELRGSASDSADTGLSDGSKGYAATNVLRTVLTPEELDRRLEALLDDSTSLMREQGVNVLYLAVGFLRWFEPDAPQTPRDAPLLLVPVVLERGRGGQRFSLSWTEGEIETNLTLKVRMKSDFGILLPDVSAAEDLSPTVYFESVQKAISGQRGWEVLSNDIVLWCFSFTRLLMYRDLDPGYWPHHRRLEDQPLIRALLQDGFPPVEPLCSAEANIDNLFDPARTMHVVDCDSSQSLVVEEAARGTSLVIQGPPGTGKSQTICNLIAAAVASGRTILFVAEKMAALEVVKRRLDNIGLGDLCLELHSKKSNKKMMLQEVARTLKLGAPRLPAELPGIIQQLRDKQNLLNRYVRIMHQPFGQCGLTPYQVLGELIELRAAGTPLPDFQLPEAAAWTPVDYARKLDSVTDLARVIAAIGDPIKHPWRGSQLEQILPLDLERLLTAAPQRVTELDALTAAAVNLSERLQDDCPTTLSGIVRLLRTVDALMNAPELDVRVMGGMFWSDHRQTVRELADFARDILTANQKLAGRVSSAAWDQDVSVDREAYSKFGRCWCRLFHAAYRKARHTLANLLTVSVPGSFEQRFEILDLLHKRQIAIRKLGEADRAGQKAFGRFWNGPQTDLKRIVKWEAWDDATVQSGVSPRFRAMLCLPERMDEIKLLAADVSRRLLSFVTSYKGLGETLKLNFSAAFRATGADGDEATDKLSSMLITVTDNWSSGTAQRFLASASSGTHQQDPLAPILAVSEICLSEIRERLTLWAENPEGLQQWQTYRRSIEAVGTIGHGVLVEQIAAGRINPADAPAMFQLARAEAVLRSILKTHSELEGFDGDKFEALIDAFCDLDIRRLELARLEVADAHWRGIGRSRGGNMLESVQLLKHEMQKQRRHLPLRELLSRAGTAVQAVKPVFMMSPLSVAQYLEPGVLDFDMLLIDEASQVRPVEALGAAARCRQMVVVGDDKQMPPTRFFGRVMGDTNDDDAPQMQASDVESILGLAIARNMPQRMLRWHYRSRHESLIAVSNQEFYDNQLYVVPSPERSGELGVKWNFVEAGRFLKGRNEVEAKAVAAAIIRHAHERPEWTLGVAAFSVSQRDAILEELATLRKNDSGLDSFFDPNAVDPFFVKNLENVQGDERDAIFVSVGYGPGEDGRVSLNFGPVSASGGERRLNVLMTRAKRVLEIFSSMHSEDIDLKRATGRGPAVFREYLRFAEKGVKPSSAQSTAVKERFVAVLVRQLTERGYLVNAQVGIAGLYVDVAVVHPDNPARYVLGILVDGESSQSARSARDRNRMTDGVLTAQGWSIHHVWSLDWFRRPTEQLNRLIETIESARSIPMTGRPSRLASTVSEIPRQPDGSDPLSLAVFRSDPHRTQVGQTHPRTPQ